MKSNINRLRGLTVCAAFASVMTAAPGASALTYVAHRAVGAGTVDISITTDGTIGMLGVSNILDYNIDVVEGVHHASILGPLSGNNSIIRIFSNSVNTGISPWITATATDILFDYSAPGNTSLLFWQKLPDFGYYCVQTHSCSFSLPGPGESILATNDFAFVKDSPGSGIMVVASVASGRGVPEPATWALMIAGFGLVGSSLRRRRNAFS